MPRVGKSMDRKRQKRGPFCKCCGFSLVGVVRIKDSDVYMRMCPARDGDMCEVRQ